MNEKKTEEVPGFLNDLCATAQQLLADGKKAESDRLWDAEEENHLKQYNRSNYLDFLSKRAGFQLDAGMWLEAIDQYSRLLTFEDSSVLRCNRGLAYWELGNTKAAIDDYRKAIELDSKEVIALRALGELLVNEGQEQEGLRFLEQAVSFDEANPKSLTSLGVAYLGSKRVTEGYHLLIKALDLDPENVRAKWYVDYVEKYYDL